MARIAKEESRFAEVDLAIPLNIDETMAKVTKPDDCFGKEWDLRTTDCSKCAERDICGIVYNTLKVAPKIEEVQKEQGAKFLDLTDFKKVDQKKLFEWVKSGETTTQELIAYVMGIACTDDRTAALAYLKKFITTTEGINTKKGIVWLS